MVEDNDKDTENKQIEVTPSDKAPEKKDEIQTILNYLSSAEESPEKQQLIRALSVFVTTSYGGPPPPPFADKITSEHITMMIEGEQKDRSSTRNWNFVYFLIGAAIIVGFTLYYTIIDRMDILTPILTAIVSFAAGFGIGSRRRRR